MKIYRSWLCIVMGMMICWGCAGTGSSLETSPPPNAGEQILSAGIKSYEEGNYADSAKLLQEALTKGLRDKESEVKAHKYLAFIHCVSGREKECTDEFKKALELDPNFELRAAEAGHPLWGPVYSSVKKAKVMPEISSTPGPGEPPSVLAPKEAQAAELPSPPVPAAKILVVIKTSNMRAKPDGKSKILRVLRKGEKVETVGFSESGNWVNCKLPSGVTGWIFKDLVRDAE